MDILGPHHVLSLEPWDEDRTPFRRALYLDASTYQVERLFDVPPDAANQECGNYVLSTRGRWAYRNTILPEGRPLSVQGRRGFVVFNGDVVVPTLIDLDLDGRTGERFPAGLSQDYRATWGAVWMSLTPGEVLT